MATVEIEKLMEGLAFGSDDERKAFEKVLSNQANLELHSRRYLRREEGTRLTQAKEQAERDAAAAKAEAEREKQVSIDHMESMRAWQEEEKIRLKSEAQEEVTRFKTELRARGIDPDGVVGRELQDKNLETFRKAEPVKNDPDPRYLGIDMARSLAQTAIDLPLQMPVIMDRYRQLYGEQQADWSGFQEQARANLMKGVDVNTTAEQFFKFSDKQKEAETVALRKQIEGELETQFQERLAKMQIPGAMGQVNVNADDPVFSKEFAEKTKEADNSLDQAAREDFMRVNAELEAKGISMMQ